MKVTRNIIESLKPCSDRLTNYVKHYGDREFSKGQFMGLRSITQHDKVWVAFRLMDKEQVVKAAADIAASVLHLYEDECPGDFRPRKAIEAARIGSDAASYYTAAANAASYYTASAYAASAYAYAAVCANAATDAAANAAVCANAATDAAANAAASAAYATDAAACAAYAATDAAACAYDASRKAQEKLVRKIILNYWK